MLTRLRRPRTAAEDGASVVLVVLSLFVLLGAAALAIDAGSLWMTKRNFVADTDAAALAGAMKAAESSCDAGQVTSEANSFLAYNQGGSISGAPSVSLDCSAETVTVGFTGQAPMVFAGVLGFSQLDVHSASTARFDVDPLSLLRPLATCVTNPVVAVAGELAPAMIVSFENNKNDLTDCGAAAGNWGWLCFAENCGSNDDTDCPDDASGTSAFLRCGADPGLNLGGTPAPGPPYLPPFEAHDEDCFEGGGADDWCVTKPGSKNALQSGPQGAWPVDAALEQRVFPILLTDQTQEKSGRTEVHPKALLWVRFDGYCIDPSKTRQWPTGEWPAAERTLCQGNNFALKLAPLHVQWSADAPLPDYVLEHVPVDVRLCSVENDTRASSSICQPS